VFSRTLCPGRPGRVARRRSTPSSTPCASSSSTILPAVTQLVPATSANSPRAAIGTCTMWRKIRRRLIFRRLEEWRPFSSTPSFLGLEHNAGKPPFIPTGVRTNIRLGGAAPARHAA